MELAEELKVLWQTSFLNNLGNIMVVTVVVVKATEVSILTRNMDHISFLVKFQSKDVNFKRGGNSFFISSILPCGR